MIIKAKKNIFERTNIRGLWVHGAKFKVFETIVGANIPLDLFCVLSHLDDKITRKKEMTLRDYLGNDGRKSSKTI